MASFSQRYVHWAGSVLLTVGISMLEITGAQGSVTEGWGPLAATQNLHESRPDPAGADWLDPAVMTNSLQRQDLNQLAFAPALAYLQKIAANPARLPFQTTTPATAGRHSADVPTSPVATFNPAPVINLRYAPVYFSQLS